MKVFIVTSVDCSKDSNYTPHCLGIFNSKDDAKKYIKTMIEKFVSTTNGINVEVNKEKYFAIVNNGQYANKWNIDELEYN